MKLRYAAIASVAAVMAVSGAIPSQAAKPPATWDGLVLVKSKKLDAVYLRPGADFRPYTKVMLDPTEVAFKKNWVRDYNASSLGQSKRLDQQDADRIMAAVRTGMGDIFTKTFQKAGFEVVQAPGPDVLRVSTGVIDLAIAAPDVLTPGRSRTFTQDAGQAVLVIEAKDSTTGALLGRALDGRVAGDSRPYLRNSVTNRADFTRMFQAWADASVQGLARLKTMSPFEEGAAAQANANAK